MQDQWRHPTKWKVVAGIGTAAALGFAGIAYAESGNVSAEPPPISLQGQVSTSRIGLPEYHAVGLADHHVAGDHQPVAVALSGHDCAGDTAPVTTAPVTTAPSHDRACHVCAGHRTADSR